MSEDDNGRATARMTITLPVERLNELRQLAADSGIGLSQAASQCLSVGLVHLQSVVSPMVLLKRPEFANFVKQLAEEKELSKK